MTRESPTRRKSCGLTFLEEGGGGGAGSLSRCQCNPFSHPMMIRLLVSLCFVVTICMVLTEYRKINTHDRFSLAAAQ